MNDRKLACGITLRLLPTEYDVYLDMALTMLETILQCQRENRPCVMIVPVGPTGQYPILAELVNRLHISLEHVHFFNMDEYLLSSRQPIDAAHPMSFHARMNSEFYSRVDAAYAIPQSQRHFPLPGCEAQYDALIEQLGGAELCLGGLGINGHVAFNEPPEPGEEMTADEFAALNTRVLPISRETRTINAYGYQRGDIRGMPEYCITIGMRQILSARSIYIALNRDWQHGIARHVFSDPIQPQIPASLLRRNPQVCFCAPQSIGAGL